MAIMKKLVPWRLREHWKDTRDLFKPWYVRGDDRDNRLMRIIMSAILREEANCIDIGSHMGEFLKHFERVAPRGQHYAFEPLPEFAGRIREMHPAVRVHEIALSDSAGMTDFSHVVSGPGYSGLKQSNYHTPQTVKRIQVRSARLDDVVPPDTRVDLIKMDVEGAELQVLRGGELTIRRWRPYLLFEHGYQTADSYGTTPRMIHDLLREHRLRVFSLDGNGPHSAPAFEALCARPRPREWNFLAKP